MTSRNTLLTSEGVTLKKDNATSTAANTELTTVNGNLRFKIAEFEQRFGPPTSMPISMFGSLYAMPASHARQPMHTASRLHASKGDEHQITVADGVPGEYIYIYIYIYSNFFNYPPYGLLFF